MPTCEICDGESFYDQDGKFYCINCGTQSQDIQVEVDQQMDFENTNISQQRHLSLKTTGRNKGRKRKTHNVGRAWTAAEAFQILLKTQVDCLIKMGFNEQLKDVVKEIWFSYLRAIGMAFCDDESETISLQCKRTTGRSEKVGTLPLSVKKRRSLVPKSPKVESDFVPTSLVFDSLKDEEFYEEDKPDFIKHEEKKEEKTFIEVELLSDDDDLDDVIEEEEEKNEDLDFKPSHIDDDEDEFEQYLISAQELLRENTQESDDDDEDDNDDDNDVNENQSVGSLRIQTKNDAKNSIPLKQPITLCICFIALIHLDEPVLWSDLVRWVIEGHLSYHNIDKLAPEEMKFIGDDHHLFNPRKHPVHWKCAKLTNMLIQSLEMNLQYIKETSKIVIVALVNDLGFEESIGTLACHLFDLHDTAFTFHTSNSSCVSVDAYLMTFIIVAVKIVYSLNGKNEYCNSIRIKFLSRLNLQINQSWTDWVTKTMCKYKLKLHNGVPRREKDLKFVHDLTTYYDYCVKDLFKSFEQRPTTRMYYVPQSHWKSGFNTEAKQKYYNMFKPIIDSQHPNIDNVTRKPSSFPLSISFLGETLADLSDENKKCANCVKKKDTEKHSTFSEKSTFSNNDSEEYIIYTDFTRSSWHDSYRFLLNVLSDRIEISYFMLQLAVISTENKIFGDEFKSAFRFLAP